MPWDGKTERRSSSSDHDNVIRILESIETLIKNFDKHVLDDGIRFERVENKIWEHARYIYIGIGIIAVINILISFKH